MSWELEKDSGIVESEFYDSECFGLPPLPFILEFFPSFPERTDTRCFEYPSQHFLKTSFGTIIFNFVTSVHNKMKYASLAFGNICETIFFNHLMQSLTTNFTAVGFNPLSISFSKKLVQLSGLSSG